MKIVVDTSIWSLALRRRSRPEEATVATLRELIGASLVSMLGCIRQEILAGIRSEEQFQILRDQFRAFPDEPLQTADYERAAKFFNDCRRRGIQGSNTDFLICAAASNRGHSIFTTDRDFQRFREAIDITLYSP